MGQEGGENRPDLCKRYVNRPGTGDLTSTLGHRLDGRAIDLRHRQAKTRDDTDDGSHRLRRRETKED
jgi:hypothetical protein